MRILYIHQYFNTHREAGGTRSYSLAKYLVEMGHSVVMLTSNRDKKDWALFQRRNIDGLDVVYIKNRYSNRMGFSSRVLSFLRFMVYSTMFCLKIRNIDIVFATSTPLTVGIPAVILKHVRKIPLIFEVRDLWPELAIKMNVLKNALLISASKWLEKRIYRSSDYIVALAPGIKRGILRYNYSNKIAVVPNGSDIPLFQTANRKDRKILPVKRDDFVLIYTGTHGIANGLNYVIDVARESLRRNFNDIKFVLVGDGMIKPALIEQKNKDNLENVIFLDPVPKEGLTQLIDEADMCMQILENCPSFYYGTSPNKFFDYLAAGKPVLINYPGWISEIVLDYDCGVVVKLHDFDDFFNKVIPLIGNENKLENMGCNSLKLAKEKFDRRKLAKDFLDVFEEVYNDA